MNKKFDQALSNENDFRGKQALVDCLCQSDCNFKLIIPIQNQIERFKKGDVQVYYKGIPFLVEAEVKKVWENFRKWPPWWTSVDIPYRKHTTEALKIAVVNQLCNTLVIFNRKALLNSPHTKKNTKYMEDESFFNVDPKEGQWFFKENSIWSRYDPQL